MSLYLTLFTILKRSTSTLELLKKGQFVTFGTLFFSDIAATSVEQSEIRYKESLHREGNRLYDAEFIVADCTKVNFCFVF